VSKLCGGIKRRNGYEVFLAGIINPFIYEQEGTSIFPAFSKHLIRSTL
jgi:hypothetical protein